MNVAPDPHRDAPDSPRDVSVGLHDARCEADWNDGVCACLERAENAEMPWPPPIHGPALPRWRRILTHLGIIR